MAAEEKEDKKVEREPGAHHRHLSGWTIAALVASALVIFWFGAMVSRAGLYRQGRLLQARAGFGLVGGDQELRPHHSFGAGMMNDNQSRLTGVVTNVNGSSFTIAGHGSTNTVTTDGNTKYTGGSKVSVNDSVTVLGNTNNNTFTATQVVINP